MTNNTTYTSAWDYNAPKRFDDIAFADDVMRDDLRAYVTHPNLNGNIMLAGGFGTGKSTIAEIIARERNGDDISVFEINGADWEKGATLKTIEGTYRYASCQARSPVITINEVDRLKDEQLKLRSFLDNQKGRGLVIMTTNYIGNVDGGLKDRSDVFPIEGFAPSQAVPIVQRVLKAAGVTLRDADVEEALKREMGKARQLSLRKIGRIVDKLVLRHQSNLPPKSSPILSVV
jgi:replication-associated recombination protein RarA